MASKLGILVVVFLSIVSLPLISSASFHRAAGLQRHHHRHGHGHRHRLFHSTIFPRVEDVEEHVSFGHGDEDNERILRFANPALDGGKNEEDEHGEGRDAERHADEEDNETSALDKGKDEEDEHAGDENEMSTPTFSNPALDKGKDDEHEDEEKNEDEAEERGNGNNDETTVDPDLNEKKNEEPQPEETIVQEGVVGGPIGGLQEAFYKLSCPQAEKVADRLY